MVVSSAQAETMHGRWPARQRSIASGHRPTSQTARAHTMNNGKGARTRIQRLNR